MTIDGKRGPVLAGGLVLVSLALIASAAEAQPGPGGAVSGPTLISPGPAASGSSDETVREAGAALHDVAGIRQSYGPRIQSASPDQRLSLAQQAAREEVAAVKRHGLSVDQFNEIVQTARADPTVRSRLLAAAGINAPRQ